MDATGKRAYDKYLEGLPISKNLIETAKMEGSIEEQIQVVLRSFKEGLEVPLIAKIVSIPEEEVSKILKNEGLI